MNQQTAVRPAAAGDIDQIHALELACSQNPWSLDNIAGELSNPNSIFLIMEDGSRGQIIGFACASLIIDELEIREVAVHPDYRNMGLGSTLVNSLLSAASAKNTARVCLEVRVSNHPAIRLYEKCGFVWDGVRKGYYQDGEDAVLMSVNIC